MDNGHNPALPPIENLRYNATFWLHSLCMDVHSGKSLCQIYQTCASSPTRPTRKPKPCGRDTVCSMYKTSSVNDAAEGEGAVKQAYYGLGSTPFGS